MGKTRLNVVSLRKEGATLLVLAAFLLGDLSQGMASPTDHLRPRSARAIRIEPFAETSADGGRRDIDQRTREAARKLTDQILRQPPEKRPLYFRHFWLDLIQSPEARLEAKVFEMGDEFMEESSAEEYDAVIDAIFRSLALTWAQMKRFREVGLEESLRVVAGAVADELGEEDGRAIAAAFLEGEAAQSALEELIQTRIKDKGPWERDAELKRIFGQAAQRAGMRARTQDPEIGRRVGRAERLLDQVLGMAPSGRFARLRDVSPIAVASELQRRYVVSPGIESRPDGEDEPARDGGRRTPMAALSLTSRNFWPRLSSSLEEAFPEIGGWSEENRRHLMQLAVRFLLSAARGQKEEDVKGSINLMIRKATGQESIKRKSVRRHEIKISDLAPSLGLVYLRKDTSFLNWIFSSVSSFGKILLPLATRIEQAQGRQSTAAATAFLLSIALEYRTGEIDEAILREWLSEQSLFTDTLLSLVKTVAKDGGSRAAHPLLPTTHFQPPTSTTTSP